ncbi:MAG: NAD(P)H:quinone oxidoreductase [Erysipelotrichaceae bacterium]|nr:NAD(P)H:quinone oxidoreductase [Erysipelotrichaceae bacterium]
MSTKLAIVYYSTYGTNLTMAQWAKESAEKAGAEVRLLKVQELAPQSVIDSQPGWKAVQEATKDIPTASSVDLDWADAILFSAPTRFGNLPAQMKQFLDVQGGLWSKGKLANKAVSAMTSAQNPHGGQEATILSLYTTMYHWGAIVVAPGYTDASLFTAGGNPYGTSVSVNQKGEMVEDVRGAIEYQTKRLLMIAEKLK